MNEWKGKGMIKTLMFIHKGLDHAIFNNIKIVSKFMSYISSECSA